MSRNAWRSVVVFGVITWLVIAAVLYLATTARASELPTEETIAAADEAGLDALLVQGAANDTGLDARAYLVGVGELPSPEVAGPPAAAVSSAGGRAFPPVAPGAGYQARVRLTHYVESGVTYGGGRTHPGSTACSWNFALGTRFVLPSGETFTCNDRGLLGSSGWLDLWRRADLSRAYGPYVTVTVLQP